MNGLEKKGGVSSLANNNRVQPKTRQSEEVLAAKIIGLIIHGRVDSYMESIMATLQQRRKYLRDKQALTMIAQAKAGDRVELVGAIKPRYLIGLRGTVIERPDAYPPKRFFLWVELDHVPPRAARRWSRNIQVPASCLRIIPTAVA